MKKQWNRLWTKHKNAVLIVGICFLFSIGAMIYVNVSKYAQPEAKVNTASQEAKEQKEAENATAEQEKTKAGVTATASETGNSLAESSVKKEGEKEEREKPKISGENVKEEKEKTEETKEGKEIWQIKESYVPISEGWKDFKSAKGDITSEQKADLDAMVDNWKEGSVSDSELKANIMEYLKEQEIEYMEVSVTSQGYALYNQVPKIELSDGGNIYSFVGTYSTGKQNPNGTDKTVFYNWSAFIF